MHRWRTIVEWRGFGAATPKSLDSPMAKVFIRQKPDREYRLLPSQDWPDTICLQERVRAQ